MPGAASLLNDTLTNMSATGSIIQVDDGQTLTLSGTEIIGGTINDFSGRHRRHYRRHRRQARSTATHAQQGLVKVESGVTLTLDNVTVNGTTVTEEVTGSFEFRSIALAHS